MCTCSHAHPSHLLLVSFSCRIPEGQAEAGSLAAGRLRSLEDQLTRAKQKIHSFQKLTGDGKEGKDLPQSFEIWRNTTDFESVEVDYVWYKTKSKLWAFALSKNLSLAQRWTCSSSQPWCLIPAFGWTEVVCAFPILSSGQRDRRGCQVNREMCEWSGSCANARMAQWKRGWREKR